MKRMGKNIWFLICLVGICGCGDFLEEVSQNEMRPSSADDLQQLLMGEVYSAGHSENVFHLYLDMMTDDVTCVYSKDQMVQQYYKRYWPVYAWQFDMFEQLENSSVRGADTYDHYYRCIKGCNVVLDMLDKVTGSEGQKANVKGQSLAMRGYFYFMLVNLFAKPYNAPGIDVEKVPGVPLITTSEVSDEYPKRASIANVYSRIETDLLEALPLLREHGGKNSKFKTSEMFCYTLLSRLYLYMEKWEEAEKYASMGLAKNSSLFDMANAPYQTWGLAYHPAKNVYGRESDEVIWLGYGNSYEYDFAQSGFTFVPSPELVQLYDFTESNVNNRGDLRLRFYYEYMRDFSSPLMEFKIKYGIRREYTAETNYPIKGMRVAELYLNRAEANIHRYLQNGEERLRVSALTDLNFLRSSRYDTRNVEYKDVDYSGDDLLTFYKEERRRELAFEDHRWFDLRRYGMPEITHVYQGSESEIPATYVLPQGSDRYVLPIPRSVLDKNYNLEANP